MSREAKPRTPTPSPPPRNGPAGSGAKSQPVPRPPSASRRRAVTLLAGLPWVLLLFQVLFVLPRYEKLFREFRVPPPAPVTTLLDLAGWARAHAFVTFLITFALMGASTGLAHAVQTATVPKGRRVVVLLIVFGVPCALFVLSWVGVMGAHRTLVEGLKR